MTHSPLLQGELPNSMKPKKKQQQQKNRNCPKQNLKNLVS